MKTFLVVLAFALVAIFVLATTAESTGKTVVATNYKFSPSSVAVSKGSSVKWVLRGGVHNVVGKGWGFSAPKASGSYKHRFNRSGRYSYRCTLHPGMNGVVRVR